MNLISIFTYTQIGIFIFLVNALNKLTYNLTEMMVLVTTLTLLVVITYHKAFFVGAAIAVTDEKFNKHIKHIIKQLKITLPLHDKHISNK